MAWAYALITLVFAVTTVANMVERPDGLKIAARFIASILIVSLVSRAGRSCELRATGVSFDATAAVFLREAARGGVINVIANEPTRAPAIPAHCRSLPPVARHVLLIGASRALWTIAPAALLNAGGMPLPCKDLTWIASGERSYG